MKMTIRDLFRDYPIIADQRYQGDFTYLPEIIQVEDIHLVMQYLDRFRQPNLQVTKENKTLWQHCRGYCRFVEGQRGEKYAKQIELILQLFNTLYDIELQYFTDNYKRMIEQVRKEDKEKKEKEEAEAKRIAAEKAQRRRRYRYDEEGNDFYDDGDDGPGDGSSAGGFSRFSHYIPSWKTLVTFGALGMGLNLLSGSQQRRPANALLTLIPFAEFARNQYNRLFGGEAQNPHAVADDTFETMTTAGSMLAQSTIGVFIDAQIAQNRNILHTQLDVTRNNQREVRNNLTQIINDLRNGQYHIIVVRENLHFYTMVLAQNQEGTRRAMLFDSNSESEVIDAHGTFSDILRQHFGNQFTIAAGRIQATNDCGFYSMMVADLIIHRGFSRTLQYLVEQILTHNTPSFSHTLRTRYANLLFPHHLRPIKQKERKSNDGFQTPIPIKKDSLSSQAIQMTLREAMMNESKRKSIQSKQSNRQTLSSKKNRYSIGSNASHMSDKIEEQDVLIRFHEHYERVLHLYNQQYEQGMIIKLLNQRNSIESELTLKKLQQLDGSACEQEMASLKEKKETIQKTIKDLRLEKDTLEEDQKALEQQRFNLMNELDELELEKDQQVNEYQTRESELSEIIELSQKEHHDLSAMKEQKRTEKEDLQEEIKSLEAEIITQMIEAESYLYNESEGIPYNLNKRLQRIIDTYHEFNDSDLQDLPEFTQLIEDLKTKCAEYEEKNNQFNGLKTAVKKEINRIYNQSSRKIKTIDHSKKQLETVKKNHKKHLEDHEIKIQNIHDKIESITQQIKDLTAKSNKLQDKIHIHAQSLDQVLSTIQTLNQLVNTPHKNQAAMLQNKLKNDQQRLSHQIDILTKYRKQLEETLEKYHNIYQSLASEINNAITTRDLQTGGYRRQLNPTQVEELENLITELQRFIKQFEYYRTTLDK